MRGVYVRMRQKATVVGRKLWTQWPIEVETARRDELKRGTALALDLLGNAGKLSKVTVLTHGNT